MGQEVIRGQGVLWQHEVMCVHGAKEHSRHDYRDTNTPTFGAERRCVVMFVYLLLCFLLASLAPLSSSMSTASFALSLSPLASISFYISLVTLNLPCSALKHMCRIVMRHVNKGLHCSH